MSSFGLLRLETLHHEVQTQSTIPAEEIIDSLASDRHDEEDDVGASNITDQPTLEQTQRVYYTRGLEELESLQLLDLLPLANWKLSSFKQGCGLAQLRDDSPDTLWQSDGSNGSSNANSATNMHNNQLSNPHSVTIQFSKKVSLERISIFTNYTLDESYTPSRIRIMAGSSAWDLSEVCTVEFNKPIGWLHIIFNGIRDDCVLKCFVVKLVILANHQDGKDSHIRAIRCFGKKSAKTNNILTAIKHSFLLDLETNLSGFSTLGISLNNRNLSIDDDDESSRVLENVQEVIGFNGFQSLELKSISSIR